MKSRIYEALKEFEARLSQRLPGSTFRLIEPFEGNDIGVEIVLPVERVSFEERKKLSDIAAEIEEEYDIYFGMVIKPNLLSKGGMLTCSKHDQAQLR